MSFEAWKEGRVVASECSLPVIAPPPGMKREVVSSRLRQTLVHPDKSGVLVGLGYSADGHRIFAGQNLSGIVQLWDAASGQQLKRIETGPGNTSFREYFQLTPDVRSLFLNCGFISARPIKGKDKGLVHYEVRSGSVRAWDVETGKPRYDLPLPPDRGVVFQKLSPDGSTLLTSGVVFGDYEPTNIKWFGTLWDVRTGNRRGELPENVYPRAVFSSDSETLFTNAVNDQGEATALLLLDAASGKVRRSIAIQRKHSRVIYGAFSPDGKRVACGVQEAKEKNWLTIWDVASSREIACFEGENKGIFGYFDQPVYSPDGRVLAATQLAGSSNKQKLYLIDTVKQKLVNIVPLGKEGWIRQPVFSPDGKWVAVLSQYNPTDRSSYRANPDMLPQPRILLIQAATGEVRETIIAPPAVAVSLCFSRDGKTLASGGDGRVLLWDMTTPPGTRTPAH